MKAPARSSARWTGGKVLFDVLDGDRTVPCTISVTALQDLSGQRRFKPEDLLASFAAVRPRLEAIALGKVRAHPAGATGLVHIWSDDLDAPETADHDAALPKPALARDDGSPPARIDRDGQGSAKEQSGSEEAEGGQEAGARHRVGV